MAGKWVDGRGRWDWRGFVLLEDGEERLLKAARLVRVPSDDNCRLSSRTGRGHGA